MDPDYDIRSHDNPPAIEETSRAKPRVTLATIELRWLATTLFAVAMLANVVVPICVEGIEGSLRKWNATVYEFRLSEWIGGLAYGMKLGELVMLGVFLALGNYHWAKRLLIVVCGTLVLGSAHILGWRWASWEPPLFIGVICYLISISVTLLVGVFAGLVAKWNRWILDRPSISSSFHPINHQFDTRLLFGIMIAVAICIPLLKVTLSIADTQSPVFNEILTIALWSVWLATALCSLVILQTVAFLVPKAMKTKVAFGILILVGPFLFQLVAQTMLAFTFSWSNILMAYWVECGLIASTSCVFVMLRFIEYRLHRRN